MRPQGAAKIELMVRTETVLESWKSIRNDAAQAVDDLPEGSLDFRLTPELMSFGETARHILDAGYAITSLILEGELDFQTPDFRDKLKRCAPPLRQDAAPAALASALRLSLEEQVSRLYGQPAEWFAGLLTRWDGARLTRLEMIQFLKEHELTHRAQLFVCLRMLGVTPVTTRRRQAVK